MKINTNGLNPDSVSITDYKLVASNVARVIVATSGNLTPERIVAGISAKLGHHGTVVENSFRALRANVSVGFVRACPEVRVVQQQELRANYRVFASNSNIMMDNNDQSLWQLKKGAAGTFLARHGQEDLSSLVQAAATNRIDVPRLSQLAVNAAAEREFVAFASASGDMDYGFVVNYNDEQQKIRLVSVASRSAVVIPAACVASVLPVGAVKISRATHNRLVQAGISRADAANAIKYYTQLYSYDKPYLKLVIEQINGTASF